MLTTSSSVRTVVALCVLLVGGVALATPAAAIEDPRRPSAKVTHGPSCGPAVVRTLVTNGAEPHRVALVFDDGVEQDAADLAPGEQVELVSSDVDWGVTVDVSVTVADADGTAEDPLELDTYTRPSAEDCAAVTSPPAPPSTPTPSAPEEPSSTAPAPVPPSSTPRPAPPSTSRPSEVPTSSSPAPRPTGPAPDRDPGTSGAPGSPEQPEAGRAPTASVSPGGVLTLRARGFTPGEPVTVRIAGIDEPLTTVTAAPDGSVEAVVQIPRAAELGQATVEFVGEESAATAGLDLEVAARSQPLPDDDGSPAVVAAGLGLLAAAGALGFLGARRTRGRHTPSAG